MASSNKMGAGSFLKILTAILGIVGLVIMFVCNSKGTDYAYNGFGTLAAGSVLGIVLALLSAFAPNMDKSGLLSPVAGIASIIALVLTGINAVGGRILMISGLFSWNSMNTVGWETFYLTVATVVCFVVGALVMVIANFFAASKQA